MALSTYPCTYLGMINSYIIQFVGCEVMFLKLTSQTMGEFVSVELTIKLEFCAHRYDYGL
jgi:hypothetical protein